MELLKKNNIRLYLATDVKKNEIDKFILKFKLKKYFIKKNVYKIVKDIL